jgi:hypothetical protein
MRAINKTSQAWNLVDKKFKRVTVGQVLRTCTGVKCTLVKAEPPMTFRGSGRILVQINDTQEKLSYAPVVCDLKWIMEE